MALQKANRPLIFASCACCVLVLLALVRWDTAVVLFDWSAWSSEQAQLSRKAESLTHTLAQNAANGKGNDKLTKEIEAQGRDIDRGLHEITQMITPPAPKRTVRRTMPMDEALAMIKVQDQMRKERKIRSDRIEGAGDVTGLISEKDAADLRKLLGEPDLQPTATSRLYENCRDGSLTVEDAELCERKADAIKLLTRQAVAKQMAEISDPERADRKASLERAKEDAAKRELVADAFIGKQYLYRLAHPNQGKIGSRSKASMTGVGSKLQQLHKATPFKLVSKSARKQQLVNTYKEFLPNGSPVVCSCDSSGAGDEEMEGLSSSVRPACSCTGGKTTRYSKTETGGSLDTGPYGAWPQGLPPGPNRIDGGSQEAYKAPSQQQLAGVNAAAAADSFTAEHQFTEKMHPLLAGQPAGPGKAAAWRGGEQHKRKIGRRAIAAKVRTGRAARSTSDNGPADKKEATALGPLQLLKEAVDSAAPVKAKPRLRQLEKAIEDEEHHLAQTKVLFARELRRRQEAMQRRFARESERLRDGIEVIAAGMPPVARAATQEVLRGQASLNPPAAPLPNPLATAGLLESSGPAAGTPVSTLSSAAMARQALVDRMVAESMPVPQPSAAGGTVAAAQPAPPAAPVVKNPVVKEIMADVAQSHLFTPSAPPAADTEKAVMQAALEKQFDQVASDQPPPSAAARHAAREARSWGSLVKQMSLSITHANSPSVPSLPKPAPAAPKPPLAAPAAALHTQVPAGVGLRKEDYKRLSKEALRDLRRALSGKPTLAAAAAAAVRADAGAGGGGPAAEMRDAERVLCTIEQLKAGRCSGVHDGPTMAAAAQAAAVASGPKDYLSVPKSQVPPSPLKMASDLVHSIASLV